MTTYYKFRIGEIMAQLNPYLGFNGNCREAMEFYKSVLGGELTMQTMGESPMAAGMPPEQHNNILHSQLKNEHLILMGSDMGGESTEKGGEKLSLCMVCESKEEIERLFAALSEGGNVEHPLKEEFFGTFGDFRDKYGFRWMFQYSPEKK